MDRAEAVIVFRRENQACAEWGVIAADPRDPEDPPVLVRRPGDRPWEPFAARMSLACAEMVLSEVVLGAKFMAMCDVSGAPAAADAQSLYPRVALPEYPLWCDTAVTSRWFAAPGKLLCVDGRGPYCWLVAAGQTHDDFQSICAAIPGDWQKALLSARRRSESPGGPACHARADDLRPARLLASRSTPAPAESSASPATYRNADQCMDLLVPLVWAFASALLALQYCGPPAASAACRAAVCFGRGLASALQVRK